MKKYIKPEVFIEKYELNQHVADCAWELTNSTMDTCSAEADPDIIPGLPNLFVSFDNGCVFTTDVYGDFCYQNGSESANVFAS